MGLNRNRTAPNRIARGALFVFAASLGLTACARPQQDRSLTKAPTINGQAVAVEAEIVASGLENPWSVAFLPDGRFLVTERPGRLRIISAQGVLSEPIEGVPAVLDDGQGGLLGVALHPRFSENRRIFLSFAEPRKGGSGTAVFSGILTDRALEDGRVIFRQMPTIKSTAHFGGRLVFAPDGSLFVTLGERFSERDQAQNLANTLGKLVRIHEDGSIPSDNPFAKNGGAPEIWSYGHRNMQGAAINPATGKIWTLEHGAKGGDEINIPQAGKNYGWPIITYGVDYSGLPIGEGSKKAGMEQPIYYWNPSIAPSGMTFYTGDKYPGWTGDVFVGALAGRHLSHLDVEGDAIMGEEKLLTELGARIRDVGQGLDGYLYVLIDDADGSLLRLRPKPN